MRKLSALLISEGVLLFALWTVWTGHPYDDSTVCPTNYSEEAFRRLRIGDTKNTVIQKLGVPIWAREGDKVGVDCPGNARLAPHSVLQRADQWGYTESFHAFGSLNYHLRCLRFDHNGRLISKEGRYVFRE